MEATFALAVLSSRFNSSFSISLLEVGTEFFFCFFDGGATTELTGTEVMGQVDANIKDWINHRDGCCTGASQSW